MARKNVVWSLLVLLLLAVGYGLVAHTGARDPRPEDVAPPMPTALAAFQRVVGTGHIQCGYYALPPFFNPSTTPGSPTGLLPEVIDKIAVYLNLTVGFIPHDPNRTVPDLTDSVTDADCFATAQSVTALQALDMGQPLFYVPLYFYVAAKNTQPPSEINSAKVRIAVVDGAMGFRLVARRYGLAKPHIPPAADGVTGAFTAVANGAADVTVADPASVAAFNAAYPATPLRRLSDTPLFVQPIYIATLKGDQSLRNMIDDAILALSAQGSLQQLVKKYDSSGQSIMPPAAPIVSPYFK